MEKISFFNGDSLYYAVHGMDLQGIVFLDNTILPERLPCRFLFLARYPVCKMQAPFLLPFFNAKVELFYKNKGGIRKW